MKTNKFKIAVATVAAFCTLGQGTLKAQCCAWYDFSSSAGFTSIGSGVGISGGTITFAGASDGYLPAFVYTTLATSLSNTTWSCEFEFKPSGGTGPYHTILAFTESGSPVISAHGSRSSPGGTVTYSNTDCIEVRLSAPISSTNPAAWELIGASKVRSSGAYGYNLAVQPTWCESPGILLPSNAFSVTLYGRLSRLSATLGMISLYSDATRSTLLGCETFCIDAAVDNLTVMQSGNIPGGALARNFYGRVDNVNLCDLVPVLTGNTTVCTTAPASTYSLSNGNGCTYTNCGFPGALSYTWSGGASYSPGTYGTCFNTLTGHGNSCVIDVNTTGYVSCTVNYPCTTVVYKILVNVSTPPVAAFTSTSPYCEGETVLLNGSSSTNETSYQWSAAECNPFGTPIGAWNYGPTVNGLAGSFNLGTIISPSLLHCHKYFKVALQVFNAGCNPSSTFTIIEIVCPPDVVASASPTFICPGGSSNLSVSGANTYLWTPPTGLSCTTCSNPTATPAVTTIYTVTGTNNGCPTDAANVTVTVSTLSANAGPNYDICCYSELYPIPLTVTGGTPAYTIVWSPTTDLACSHGGIHPVANCPNPNVRTCSTITYTVTVTDAAGCVVTDQVTITPVSCRMGENGSNQTGSGNQLSIYPNPATQQATINTGDVPAESIIITDALGREVYRTTPISTITQIDLSTISEGIYMVQVITNNEIQVLQLVIAK
jgi:hypothetical protein